MEDSKLLEFAGRAAGETYNQENNPLERDDLALRLAESQGMTVYTNICAAYVRLEDGHEISVTEEPREGRLAATRRAIVRAAAEIGKEMK